jgi:hypothetical protein
VSGKDFPVYRHTDGALHQRATGNGIPKESITMADLFKENLWLVPALGATFLVVLAILTL